MKTLELVQPPHPRAYETCNLPDNCEPVARSRLEHGQVGRQKVGRHGGHMTVPSEASILMGKLKGLC